MRGFCVLAFAMLAACGSGNAPPPPEEAAPVELKGGEWTLSRTVTAYNTPTVTAQEYAAHVGKKSEEKVCVTVDAKGLPDADAIAGADGSSCKYKEAFAHNGRLVASMACKSPGGTSELSVEGNYTADSMTFGVSTNKPVGNALERTTHDLSGKRTGDCAPKPAG